MPNLVQQRCAHHPDRPGMAVCMTCRRVVCQECATPWDGVNHCRPCLARRSAGERERGGAVAWAAWTAGAVLLFVLAGRAMAWSAALAARLF